MHDPSEQTHNAAPAQGRQLLASDNASGVHPAVLAKLAQENARGHALGYGADAQSAELEARFRDVFGELARAFLVWTGSAANVLALKGMVHSHEAVLCSDRAHLWVDECGAPEHHLGSKLIPVPSVEGKLRLDDLERIVARDRGVVHRSQPRVISIAQPTERGTLYTLGELRAIAQLARERGLLLHMDGARLANAAAALGCELRELTTDVGVDVVSFGGTKNGLMMAEAIVVLRAELAPAYPFIRKQGMQLASKHRFLAAQFLAYFERELWRQNAERANTMARYLAEQLTSIDGVHLGPPVQANLVFARLPRAWIEPLQRITPCLVAPDGSLMEARFVTSFDTTREHIDGFIHSLLTLTDREGPP